jgi:hypothetical protein
LRLLKTQMRLFSRAASQQRKKGVSPQGAVVVFLRFLETIWFMN